jgi:SOS-response transcriptional repressor LexA
LQVRGDSMIDAAILDGDWVAMRRQPNAANGVIIVAMINNEATVKAFAPRSRPRLADAAEPRVRSDPCPEGRDSRQVATVLAAMDTVPPQPLDGFLAKTGLDFTPFCNPTIEEP